MGPVVRHPSGSQVGRPRYRRRHHHDWDSKPGAALPGSHGGTGETAECRPREARGRKMSQPPTIRYQGHTPMSSGQPSPIGATVVRDGINFSLFSRTANGVELLLFDRESDAKPARIIRLDPATDRIYHYWNTFVPGIRAGQLYGYRVHGPNNPGTGLRF